MAHGELERWHLDFRDENILKMIVNNLGIKFLYSKLPILIVRGNSKIISQFFLLCLAWVDTSYNDFPEAQLVETAQGIHVTSGELLLIYVIIPVYLHWPADISCS